LEGFFLVEVLRAHSTLFFHYKKSYHDNDRVDVSEYADKVVNFTITCG